MLFVGEHHHAGVLGNHLSAFCLCDGACKDILHSGGDTLVAVAHNCRANEALARHRPRFLQNESEQANNLFVADLVALGHFVGVGKAYLPEALGVCPFLPDKDFVSALDLAMFDLLYNLVVSCLHVGAAAREAKALANSITKACFFDRSLCLDERLESLDD